MKSKYVTAGAVALFALASCSNDEIIDSSQTDPNLITYTITSNNISRANNIYSSTNLPQAFYLSAALSTKNTDGTYKPYFTDDFLEKTDNEFVDQNGGRYWPEDKALDFFAIQYDKDSTNPNPNYTDFTTGFTIHKFGSATTATACYAVKGYVSDKLATSATVADAAMQPDLIYAVTKGRTRSDGKVALNFRHALSQLNFTFTNNVSTILVEIDAVTLNKAYYDGDLYIGNAATGSNYTYNEDDPETYDYSNDCEWDTSSATKSAMRSSAAVRYIANQDSKLTERVIYPSASKVPLVYDVKTTPTYTEGAIMTVPQVFNVYTGDDEYTDLSKTTNDCAYFSIACRVYSIDDEAALIKYVNDNAVSKISGATKILLTTDNSLATAAEYLEKAQIKLSDVAKNSTSIVQTYDGITKPVLVPVPEIKADNKSVGWQAGKRYTYNFIFGDDWNARRKIGVNASIDDWSTYKLAEDDSKGEEEKEEEEG
jgi:hypothetical protein